MDGMEIRLATLADIDTLVELRMALLVESAGAKPDDRHLRVCFRDYFQRALPSGEFIGFVADYETRIHATGGLVFHQNAPTVHNRAGRIAYILNMYTIPESRGCGLATLLSQHLIEFARQSGCGLITLDAMPAGRGIYEKAGFIASTTQMRLQLT